MTAGSMYPALYGGQWGRPAASWYHPNNAATISAQYPPSLPPTQPDMKPKGRHAILFNKYKSNNNTLVYKVMMHHLFTKNLFTKFICMFQLKTMPHNILMLTKLSLFMKLYRI